MNIYIDHVCTVISHLHLQYCRYQPGDRFANDRYNGADRYPLNGYGKDRGFDRDSGARGGDRYGSGGPARNEGKSYRSRPDPYDRPNRGGRPSSFDRY